MENKVEIYKDLNTREENEENTDKKKLKNLKDTDT